jgi:hypothetical protein
MIDLFRAMHEIFVPTIILFGVELYLSQMQGFGLLQIGPGSRA